MYKIRIKNFLRLSIGLLSLLSPLSDTRRLRVYCNLRGGKVSGGPDRFLKSITTSHNLKNAFGISNWSLSSCRAALIFSASWGRSFSVICKLFKIKSVLRVDGFYVPEDKIDEDYQQSIEFRDWLNGRLTDDLKSFEYIIYQSEFSKKICDSHLFHRKEKYSIIPNGTNIKIFKPDKTIENKIIKIVILGKHYPKHLNLAISIFTKATKSFEAELYIIGPMRNGVDGVSDYIDKYVLDKSIREKVFCLGIRSYEELPTLLSSYDILLHVKVGDWCPNAVLEAMASGLPVVCPKWGGTRELVGEAGISVDGPEWGVDDSLTLGMTEALIEIHKNLKKYKYRARERVVRLYNIEDISKKYLKALNF